MERIPFGMAQLDVDGSGYLPGGGESAELSESLTDWEHTGAAGEPYDEEPEQARERIDASLFAAMLHP
ncbi:MAG: hypothetical protein QOG63_2022 [Thermoleophilaceae bacterium]|jgi:hypothetical protein|nr:hypothetical protein [Thermoleophilaceae bacterium]